MKYGWRISHCTIIYIYYSIYIYIYYNVYIYIYIIDWWWDPRIEIHNDPIFQLTKLDVHSPGGLFSPGWLWARTQGGCCIDECLDGGVFSRNGLCIPIVIELDDGKIYRKTLYLMVKTMVSCKFSLKPIQWYRNRDGPLGKFQWG